MVAYLPPLPPGGNKLDLFSATETETESVARDRDWPQFNFLNAITGGAVCLPKGLAPRPHHPSIHHPPFSPCHIFSHFFVIPVIRCRDLQRSHGGNGGSINAYVKVALSGGSGYGSGSGSGSSGRRDQRTAVHRHSSRPYFDQRFSFPISGGDFKDNDQEQSLQLAVWHRDRHLK